MFIRASPCVVNNHSLKPDQKAVAAWGCLPPGANVFVAAPTPAIRSPIDILMVTTIRNPLNPSCSANASSPEAAKFQNSIFLPLQMPPLHSTARGTALSLSEGCCLHSVQAVVKNLWVYNLLILWYMLLYIITKLKESYCYHFSAHLTLWEWALALAFLYVCLTRALWQNKSSVSISTPYDRGILLVSC